MLCSIAETGDWADYPKNTAFDCSMKLKGKGVAHHIGLSSHTPAAIQKALDEVPADTVTVT